MVLRPLELVCGKNVEKFATVVLVKCRNAVSGAERAILVGVQKTRRQTALWTAKDVLIQLQRTQTVRNGLRNHLHYIRTRRLTTFS